MRFFILFLSSMVFAFFSVQAQEKSIGEYSKPLTDTEKAKIDFIITTLSDHSTLGLMMYRKQLEAAGESIDHVHPLRHLGYVFSNPNLTSRTYKIGRVPWKRYVKDFGKPLTLALKQGKLDQSVLDDFSKAVNIDVKTLEPYVQQRDWPGFVNTLRNQKQ